MSETLLPAYIAVVFGLGIAVVLVVPFAAIQYRRRGGLTSGIVALDFFVLLYFVALVAYTLLPLPERVANFCQVQTASPQLIPGQFISDTTREAAARGGGMTAYLRNPATLQIVFNVALFVPLGMIVRYFRKVPVIVVVLIGLGASLLIETTQITGDWFLYPCAYRLFDVDDLIANTLGALVGALLAPVLRVIPGQQAMRPGEPRSVTVLRRLLGMLCDWVVFTGAGVAVAFVYLVVVPDRTIVSGSVDVFFRYAAGGLVVVIVQFVWILASSRTIGETIVRIEPTPPADVGGRVIRWLGGVGGYGVLSLVLSVAGGAVSSALLFVVGAGVVGSILAAFTTRRHRGLAYVFARWDVQDDRSPDASSSTPSAAEGTPVS